MWGGGKRVSVVVKVGGEDMEGVGGCECRIRVGDRGGVKGG